PHSLQRTSSPRHHVEIAASSRSHNSVETTGPIVDSCKPPSERLCAVQVRGTHGGCMPVCKDPSLTFLNQFGYNVIKLPRTGIEPMHVVGRDETTQLLGPLSSVWKSTLPVPTPNAPRSAADVNGQRTDKIDLKFSLKILENALKAFGASVPSLGFAFKKARNISFEFTNVTSTTVEPFDAGNYLSAGDLNTLN